MGKRGMSLIEVVVVVAIIAVGAGMAIPNYLQWSSNEDLKAGVSDLKGALQIARVSAMASGVPVAVSFNKPNADQYGIFIDNGVGGGVARDGIWTADEVTISPDGQQLPTAQAANAVQKFKGGIVFAPAPLQPTPAIEFLSSGRRSLPNDQLDTVITLQNDFGLQKQITVSPIGDIR